MPIRSKIDGTLKEITNCKVKVNGDWKQGSKAYVKVNGEWKEVWNFSTIVRLEKFLNFYIPIKDYDGGDIQSVTVKNIKLRLYNNYTNGVNECVAEDNFGDVTISINDSEKLEVAVYNDYSWRVSASMDIYNGQIRVSATVMPMEDYAYAEFEYSVAVINN